MTTLAPHDHMCRILGIARTAPGQWLALAPYRTAGKVLDDLAGWLALQDGEADGAGRLLARWAREREQRLGFDAARAGCAVVAHLLQWAAGNDRAALGLEGRLGGLCRSLGITLAQLEAWLAGLPTPWTRGDARAGLCAFARSLPEGSGWQQASGPGFFAWIEEETRRFGPDRAWRLGKSVLAFLGEVVRRRAEGPTEGAPGEEPARAAKRPGDAEGDAGEALPAEHRIRKDSALDGLSCALHATRDELDLWVESLSAGNRHLAASALRRFGRWLDEEKIVGPGAGDVERWHEAVSTSASAGTARRYRQRVLECLAWLDTRHACHDARSR